MALSITGMGLVILLETGEFRLGLSKIHCFTKCDPILENQAYRGIIDFEIWLCKVTTGVLGQK